MHAPSRPYTYSPPIHNFVLQNKDPKRGETPKGSFSGRTNHPGVWPHSGPEAMVGHEEWRLSKDHDPARLDQVFEIMAEHLGGAALERYHAAVVKQEEEAEAPAVRL